MKAEGIAAPPSLETRILARERLRAFLAGHFARYAHGESTSLPAETARALTESALLVLGLEPDDPALWEKLPPEPLEEAFSRGLRRLDRKAVMGRRMWQEVCTHLPALGSRSMNETLRSIGGFYRRYDPHWFAREVSCDIDYQLFQPVPETLAGVDYVNEYLRRLIVENRFLRRFPPARCMETLERACPHYRVVPVNLYEPVAAAAVGAVLSGGDDALKPRWEGLGWLRELSAAAFETALLDAAQTVARERALQSGAERGYLAEAARALGPRLRAALDAPDGANVF